MPGQWLAFKNLLPPKGILATILLFLTTAPSLAILLGSCISPVLAHLHPYLFRILEPNNETRIAYFGLCTGTAPKLKCSSTPPSSKFNHIALAIASRASVFIPWIAITAGACWSVAMVLTWFCQSRVLPNPRIDQITHLLCAVAFWIQLCALVMIHFGARGILLSLQYAGDGTKMEAGSGMLGLHLTLLVLYGILWMVNWLVSTERGARMGISRFFFARRMPGGEVGGVAAGFPA